MGRDLTNIKLLQVFAVGQSGWYGAGVELVVPQAESLELSQVTDIRREVQQFVVLEVQLDQLATLSDLLGQVLQLVVAAVESVKFPQFPDGCW